MYLTTALEQLKLQIDAAKSGKSEPASAAATAAVTPAVDASPSPDSASDTQPAAIVFPQPVSVAGSATETVSTAPMVAAVSVASSALAEPVEVPTLPPSPTPPPVPLVAAAPPSDKKLAFADLMKMVQAGEVPPGIKDIPDQLSVDAGGAAIVKGVSPPKPWAAAAAQPAFRAPSSVEHFSDGKPK